MFPQFKKIDNESGIILFIVLMTAIIILIYSLSILTQSMNEINYAQQQIDQISSEQLAKGAFWNAYANTTAATAGVTNSSSPLTAAFGNGRQYTVNTQTYQQGQGTCPAGVGNCWTIFTNYDTFQ